LIVPRPRQIVAEAISRVNVFSSVKHWVAFTGWFWVLALAPFFLLFVFKYFTWWGLAAGFVYSMVLMGSYGTIWFHRYSTHRSFTFSHPLWRSLTRNLVIRVLPEETYVLSHHVHHAKSDRPGDPYNAAGGFLYCFLSDATHQTIAPVLSETDYARAAGLLKHTGIVCNSYAQYQRWGSVAHPGRTFAGCALNWAAWYAIFYVVGGNTLAVTLFASAMIWALGVRTFNYEGHGKGHDKRKDGVDFNRADMSINQWWPGLVAGEWHNNHHLFPSSARSGFLRFQLDLPWIYIRCLSALGAVNSFNDARAVFHEKYAHASSEETAVTTRHVG
jgi:sn-1 stearoyl-lipid 9-desaturase